MKRVKPADQVDFIVADWRTGNFTQRDLAAKYKVSLGFVSKYVKDVFQDTKQVVNKIIEAKQMLAVLDEQAVNSVHEVVDEKTKYINFFNEQAVTNVKEAMNLDCETQSDFRQRAETINKGRECVLGKTPDTAIQINNNGGESILSKVVKDG